MDRPTGHAPRARTGRRLLVVVLAGAALAAVALLWWAGTSGGPGGAGSAAPGDRRDAAAGGYLASAVGAADAVASAVAWLGATRSVSYADGSPSGWVDRARPVVTDRLAAEYERRRDGNAGADWPDFVAAGCMSVASPTTRRSPARRGPGPHPRPARDVLTRPSRPRPHRRPATRGDTRALDLRIPGNNPENDLHASSKIHSPPTRGFGSEHGNEV